MAGLGRYLNSIPGLFVILILLTLLGAIIFQKIEAPKEHHSRLHVSKTRQKIFVLAQKLSRKGENADWSKLVAQVDRYREKLHEAWLAGTDEMTIDIPSRWSVWGSIYYCFTLFTTIGYGDLFPATTLGKLLTIVYGSIAMPICSLLISRISSGLVRFSKAINLMTLESSSVPMGLREAYNRTDASFNFRTLPCLILFAGYLVIGAVIYSYIGAGTSLIKWNKFDAIYFAFITITTVGFGDLVPQMDILFAISSICYILVGLALTGIVFGRLTMSFDQFLSRTHQTKMDQHPPEQTRKHTRTTVATTSHIKRS